MKKQSVIKSVETKINIPEPVLVSAITKWKKDADNFSKKETGYLPEGYQNFSWSSALSKISGNTEIAFVSGHDEKVQYLNIPFTSWFLFSCIKDNDEACKIGWGVSLS